MSTSSKLPQLQIRKQGESEFNLSRCSWAKTLTSRFWGLMTRSQLPSNEGLLIEPCNQIHMFFMKFPIDALFLDNSDRIVAVESIKPWRLSRLHFKAKKVLEVAQGSAEKWGWSAGDALEIVSVGTRGKL